MQGRDDLGAFADRGSDPFDRFGADVADGENAAAARFQRMAIQAGIRAR